jgi:hypothetical protein
MIDVASRHARTLRRQRIKYQFFEEEIFPVNQSSRASIDVIRRGVT